MKIYVHGQISIFQKYTSRDFGNVYKKSEDKNKNYSCLDDNLNYKNLKFASKIYIIMTRMYMQRKKDKLKTALIAKSIVLFASKVIVLFRQ